jgi:hypothetical protein
MRTLQCSRWIRPICGGLLSLSLLGSCGGTSPPQTVTAADPNTYDKDRQEVSLNDGCAGERAPFASVVEWLNCVGAALGAPLNGEANDSSSLRYASRTPP